MLAKIYNAYKKKTRTNRAQLFLKLLRPTEQDKILDLGGSDGAHIASIIPYRKNVTIADISKRRLKMAEKKFGFNTLELREDGTIPVEEKHYDIIFCSSVIEHVTVDKDLMYSFSSNKEFRNQSLQRQKLFAAEITKKCKSYFVQTPYKYFLIESHSWLPGIIVFLPRKMQVSILLFFSKFWPKQARPDFNLLTIKDMQSLFPDAEIRVERSFGFIKSTMAIKVDSERARKLNLNSQTKESTIV